MLERVPTVLSAQEILDKAFHKAAKIDVFDPVKYHRIRKTESARLKSAVDNITESLARYPRAFPNLDRLRDYNVEVLDIVVGLPRLRKALGSVRWAAEKVRDIGRETEKRMLRERTIDGFFQARKRAYGRISSIVQDVDKDLAVLAEARDKVKALPTISPDFATVVIAGYPNVGKSSLLAAWTAARPEIAGYAFTTKRAEVGHFEVADSQDVVTKYQVVDTPGLLDRPEEDRNDVERQAVAALQHAADAVLFLLDPSEFCGYSMEAQEHLLEQVRKQMAGLPILVAESKCDLKRTDSENMKFSVTTGEGVEELRDATLALLRFEHDVDLEEDPLQKWVKPAEKEDW